MPLVPAAGYPTESYPQVPTPAAPPSDYLNIRATPESFGGGVGQAEERAGAVIERGAGELSAAAIQTQGLYNQIVADDAQTQYMKESHRILFGDPAAGDTGFFGKRGQDAMTAAPLVAKQLDQVKDQISGGLGNARQRLEFNEYTRRLRAYTDKDVLTHYEKEMQSYGQEVQKDSGITAIQEAGNYYNNPDRIQAAIQKSDQANVRYAQGLFGAGASGEILQKYVNIGRDNIAKAVVDGYLSHNDPVGAEKWLKSHEGFVTDPRVQEQLFKETHDKSIHARVIGEVFGPSGGQPTVNAKQLEDAAVQKGLDPKLVQATALIESSNGANVGNPAKSQYAGNIFQVGTRERAALGVTGQGTPSEQVDYGTRQLLKVRDEMATKLGRPPTNFEVYLAHQQGVPGANALLNNPNTPAGKVISDVTGGKEGGAKISGNGGDPNAPASQFTSMWARKYAQAEGGSPQQTNFTQQIEHLRQIFPNPEDFAKAVTAAEAQQRMINMDLSTKARAEHDANQKAANGYMSRIIKPDGNITGMLNEIADDPHLNWETKKSLATAAESKLSGDVAHAEATYGPGFWSAFKSINLPLGEPGRINDVSQLLARAGPGGDLNLAGVDKLTQILTSKKTPEGQAEAALEAEMFKSAHRILTGGSEHMMTKDPRGEDHFRKFMEAAYPLMAKAKAEGKSSAEIRDLEKGPLAPLLKPGGGLLRTPAEIAADMALELGGTPAPAAPGAPQVGAPPAGTIKYDKAGNRIP